jgi:hypothetical protein
MASIPEDHGETQTLLVVTEALETVFAPGIGPGSGLIVIERLPGGVVGAIIRANRFPGPLGEIRSPESPVFALGSRVLKLLCFDRVG